MKVRAKQRSTAKDMKMWLSLFAAAYEYLCPPSTWRGHIAIAFSIRVHLELDFWTTT
jgi:hypothetical protein